MIYEYWYLLFLLLLILHLLLFILNHYLLYYIFISILKWIYYNRLLLIQHMQQDLLFIPIYFYSLFSIYKILGYIFITSIITIIGFIPFLFRSSYISSNNNRCHSIIALLRDPRISSLIKMHVYIYLYLLWYLLLILMTEYYIFLFLFFYYF